MAKLILQIERFSEITQNLMRITRYETRSYLQSKIIDIEKASRSQSSDR